MECILIILGIMLLVVGWKTFDNSKQIKKIKQVVQIKEK
jgi:hypothetical protein